MDQSLFSESYREIDYWSDMIEPTWIAPLGIAAYTAMDFLAGHVIWSYVIPIALVETLQPALSREPWLRRPGLILTALLYLGAAMLVLVDHLQHEKDHASAAQISGSVVVVVFLVGLACTAGRRALPARDTFVPVPFVLGILSLIAALAFNFVPPTWPGVAVGITILAAQCRVLWTSRAIDAVAWSTHGRSGHGRIAGPRHHWIFRCSTRKCAAIREICAQRRVSYGRCPASSMGSVSQSTGS